MEGTDPWIHRPPSVISISIAKLTKISTDLILMRIILFRDKAMRMGLPAVCRSSSSVVLFAVGVWLQQPIGKGKEMYDFQGIRKSVDASIARS